MIVLGSGVFRFLYIIYIAVTCYAATTGYESDNYKYFFLAIPVVYGFLLLIADRKKIKIKSYLITQMGIIAIAFIAISFLAMLINGMELHFFKDLMYLVMPLLLVFMIFNVDSNPNKDFYMNLLMLGEIIFFLSFHFFTMLDINNFLSINFLKSYSPFEHYASQPLTACFTYFYARKKYGRAALCFFFAFLSFKRLAVVFIFFILVFGWLFRKKKVPIWLINTTAIAFILSPLILDVLLSPQFVNWFDSTFEMTFDQFTMGRFTQLSYVMNYEGILLGRGMVHDFLATPELTVVSTYFHADLLRIYIETTLIGLFIFTFGYFNLVKLHRNYYCYFYMVLVFTTMFASVLLHGVTSMIPLFIICCTNFDALEQDDKQSKLLKRKQPRKFVLAFTKAHGTLYSLK